jgi:hypothetical protein
MRIATLAPRMLEAVRMISESTALPLRARIGIHTGAVVAGVLGTRKFVYDVWGDTVNTASRMESHSLAGRIQVSAATRAALGIGFTFEPRGALEIKGKGADGDVFSGRGTGVSGGRGELGGARGAAPSTVPFSSATCARPPQVSLSREPARVRPGNGERRTHITRFGGELAGREGSEDRFHNDRPYLVRRFRP